MANANRPSGLSPVRYADGSPWNGQTNVYYIASNDGNAFAIGDPVTLSGSADTKGVEGITLGAAGGPYVGVIVGMGGTVYGGPGADPTNLNTTVIPATKSQAYYVRVVDDPNVIFEAQEVGTGTQLTADEVGLNANLVAGSNNGFISGWMIDNTTEATTATLAVKLLGLVQRPDNAFGAYAKWLVKINNHVFNAGIAGI